jgi:hypothetical protein
MKRANRKHGLSYAPEYRAWQAMRLRCTNPEHAAWADYGGRGITVCAEWLDSPQAFIDHIGRKPSPRHELDRIDNDRGYEPGNVRWATRSQNDRNRRSTRWVTAHGETLPVIAWAERLGGDIQASASAITKRLDNGWDPDLAVSQPVRFRAPRCKVEIDGAIVLGDRLAAGRIRSGWDPIAAVQTPPVRGRRYELDGEWLTLVELSRLSGLARRTIRDRIERGVTVREAISVPRSNAGPLGHRRAA